MTKQFVVSVACALWMAGAGSGFAASASLVKLTVSKSENKDYKEKKGEAKHPRVAAVRSKETGETVSYTIDAFNVSGQALANVEIHWGVLINLPGKPLRVESGKQSCDLKPGQKFSFEAGPIEIRSKGGEIEGYSVEALMDGKVVASDIQPADIKG